MAELIASPSVERVRENLEQVRREIEQAGAAAGRWSSSDRAAEVEVLAATKYIALADLPKLAQAGVTLVGENRAQDLQEKVAAHGELFTWDFIGQLQSRRVRAIVPHVRLIHSVASDSALRELQRHREHARPGLQILIEVNVAREPGKAGVLPEELDGFIERATPLPVAGLMTMAPLDPRRHPDGRDRACAVPGTAACGRPSSAACGTAEHYDSNRASANRRWFAALRELAAARGLQQLSMGTTQDYLAAVAEGATLVRIGARLYA